MSRAAVDAGHEAFLDALRASDVDALMNLLTEDVTFYPPDHAPARGKPAVRDWYAGVVSEVGTDSVAIHTRRVTISGDVAVEEGTYTWVLAPVGGGDLITVDGSFIATWRAEPDGSWRCFADIWNNPD